MILILKGFAPFFSTLYFVFVISYAFFLLLVPFVPGILGKMCNHTIPNEHGRELVLHKDWFCCACNAGEYVLKYCESGNKSTTVCRPCIFNETNPEMQTYMEHGYHLENQCIKSNASCPPGFFRVLGNRTTPAKCYSKLILENLAPDAGPQISHQTEGIPYPYDVIIIAVLVLVICAFIFYLCKKKMQSRNRQNTEMNGGIRMHQPRNTHPGIQNNHLQNTTNNIESSTNGNISPSPNADPDPDTTLPQPRDSVNIEDDTIPSPQDEEPLQGPPPEEDVETITDHADTTASPLLGAAGMQAQTKESSQFLQQTPRQEKCTTVDADDGLVGGCGSTPAPSIKPTSSSMNCEKKRNEKDSLNKIALDLSKIITVPDAAHFLRTFGASTDDLDEAKGSGVDPRERFVRVFEKCQKSPSGKKVCPTNILKHLEQNHLTDCVTAVQNIMVENRS